MEARLILGQMFINLNKFPNRWEGNKHLGRDKTPDDKIYLGTQILGVLRLLKIFAWILAMCLFH